MLIPFILCVVLIIMGKEDLDASWIWGILAFLVIAIVAIMEFKLNPTIFVVPIVIVDIVLILKVFGSDITIR
jgi:hypothetical protein